ncbi:MAG: M20/M25/M40 family metallo-hydrolase [Candidatus Hodarchaeales archaeon]|jgi:acetylornithine deacetylase/succinyl-diaminopimelate desuccinylase-like protein
MESDSRYVDEVNQLLITLVQNKCINPPGNELKSIRTIEKYLKDRDIPCQVFESAPNRGNLISEIKGTGNRPSLMFGPSHVDVVPIGNESAWDVDPFSGIIKDDHIWGRGTTDMLFIVATQVQAFVRLFEEQFRPKGDLKLCIVADEEAGGIYGTEWLMKHQPDFMRVDYALSEAGGIPIAPGKLLLGIGEKGASWKRVSFKGTPSHGSMPYKSDNAVIKAAIAAERLNKYTPPINLDYIKLMANGLGLSKIIRLMLSHRIFLPIVLKMAHKQNPVMARLLHALSRMTISPNIVHGGTKTNIVAGEAYLDVDIRILPNQDDEFVIKHLRKAMGKLGKEAIIERPPDQPGFFTSEGTASDPNSEIIPFMRNAVAEVYPNAQFVPLIVAGATDLRYLRERGTQAYGFSLFDPETPLNTMATLPHGPNERISLKTVEYSLMAYYNLAKEFLS